MENHLETPHPPRHSKAGLLAVPLHSAVGSSRPKSLPQRLNMYHTRRPSTSSPLATSQIQADSPKTPVRGDAPFETRAGEQTAESTFYKRLRIDVSEPVGNVSRGYLYLSAI